MATAPTQFGALRVVGGADTTAAIDAANAQRAALTAPPPEPSMTGLASFLHNQFELMRRHRDNVTSGWALRLLEALRVFNGQYSPEQLQAIRQYGGSEVYARVIAMKCRGASSLLRDVFLGGERAWGIDPDPNPQIPPEVMNAIGVLVQSELASAHAAGQPPDANAIRDRVAQLTEAARQAAKKKAADQAKIAEDKVEEILQEGGFYNALDEFLTDLPLFPYACIKGPSVRLRTRVTWQNGKAISTDEPRLIWTRVSPFDIYWTPGVSDVADANVIERSRLTRGEINDLLDLPGYNVAEVRAVLDEYGRGGLDDNWDLTDSERAVQENRENPRLNRSGLISCLEFQGYAQGRLLLEAGMDPSLIPDDLRDYYVQAWLIGRHVVKVQLAPSPRKRHQYYLTSFEKVPGTPVGNALPDILSDIQNVCNATLRALVNNLAIASGPQVVINDDRLAEGETGEQLYPWKRWHMRSDPFGNNVAPPVEFFQPTANSQEFLGVYSAFSELADELSAIPRYMTGAQAGAVGRTASGLSMLMSNSSKILQTVAANIDRDVVKGILQGLFDMILLTDTTGLLTGEENIRVRGVNVAMQKETQRARQLEFLQLTGNPVDLQIVGPKGRAAILREVASTLGMPGEQIVPSDDVLTAMQKQAAAAAQNQGVPGHAGMGDNAAQTQGNQQGSPVNGDVGPRTNVATPTISGGPQ
ncbi:MAG: hemophilus-specific protein [Patescibacteria group bacterium]|nr:hemophilus-specific protein [Patescibacteria group bacterium]